MNNKLKIVRIVGLFIAFAAIIFSIFSMIYKTPILMIIMQVANGLLFIFLIIYLIMLYKKK